MAATTTVKEHIWIPLPDGRRLAARMWLPAGEGPFPAILEYLPYRKRDGTAPRDATTHPVFAAEGYVCLRVDIAGTGDSEGICLGEYLQQEQDDALAVIDWQTQFLPDAISLPLLWLGLLISLGHGAGFAQVDPATAIIGAAAGYLVLWLVFQLFLLATGKQGMGYGDFKLLAVVGAWLGWQALPMVLLMASTAGALIGGALMASGRLARGKPMPFGPWLAIAGWLAQFYDPSNEVPYFLILGAIAIGMGVVLLLVSRPVLALKKGVR